MCLVFLFLAFFLFIELLIFIFDVKYVSLYLVPSRLVVREPEYFCVMNFTKLRTAAS